MTFPANPVVSPGGCRRHEQVIIAALRSGDMRRAVELLLEAYQDDVYLYCVRLMGPIEAPRVYQRVLAAAIDDLATRDRHRTLRAWLFGLARRLITHEHRMAQPTDADVVDPDYVPVNGLPGQPVLFLQGARADAAEAVSSLQPAVCEVLQLSLWHGLNLTEVARITDRGLAEVREMAGAGLAQLAYRSTAPDEVLS